MFAFVFHENNGTQSSLGVKQSRCQTFNYLILVLETVAVLSRLKWGESQEFIFPALYIM